MRRAKFSAAIRVEGPDSLEFLEGQFSNDLSKIAIGYCVYGLWLNQKGKILADSHVLRTGEESFLILSRLGAADVIFDRLDTYIIMDDVVLCGNIFWRNWSRSNRKCPMRLLSSNCGKREGSRLEKMCW